MCVRERVRVFECECECVCWRIWTPATPDQTRDFHFHTHLRVKGDSHRAVAGKLGRFNEKHFQEFVPGSFKWTDCMSRPGTNFSISENISR